MFTSGPLELSGPGAGDREPYVEMEIMWTPEGDEVDLSGPEDHVDCDLFRVV